MDHDPGVAVPLRLGAGRGAMNPYRLPTANFNRWHWLQRPRWWARLLGAQGRCTCRICQRWWA